MVPGPAQGEAMVKLLEELNTLAEGNATLRVLVDAADRVSVFNDRARARAWLLEG